MSYGQTAGVSVETILSEPNCRPGGVVAGKVHLAGGARPADIRNVTIALMPRMENGYGGETAGPEVYRGALTRAFRLEPGQRRDLSFSIPLPYELPFTTVLGRELPGFTIGLCTEVAVQGAPDPGDVDPISVEPLKSQQWVLAAIARLGFRIRNVAFERSKLAGVPQQLPFYQEIRLAPPSQYEGRVGEVGLSFVASPRSMMFVLVADRRSGGSDDTAARFSAEHPESAETDWFTMIREWLDTVASRPRPHAQGQGQGQAGPPPLGSPDMGAPSPGSFQSPPLPPPGGGPSTFPAPPGPPGQHGVPAPAAASYGEPGAYGQPAQGPFPPPAPGPAQGGPTPPPPPAHGTPYPPAPPGPQYPPPPAPQGPPPPPPAVHHHHGPPPYRGGHHHGHGLRAAGAVGGVAAAGIAGGLAAGAAVDAYGNVIGGAVNVPAAQFGDAVAGYAGGLAAEAGKAAVNEVAGEAAGAVGEILGGLLGGLFG
ncbi:hypothetical protein Acsp03_34670 [Actinomadura sp. NBRC 104412]|uniref:sporulation protein n=1 Tax=Actinomadura sp. NBRC 104412 TaxID=3032203 RepID=UPI0024A1FB88|nr:sporulation protein [Actinomadura sp. NBRC 104412]GLZ06001.1 hypothetical protein Acsp03_34670 [Actinomadura sp. NBRC 104412]